MVDELCIVAHQDDAFIMRPIAFSEILCGADPDTWSAMSLLLGDGAGAPQSSDDGEIWTPEGMRLTRRAEEVRAATIAGFSGVGFLDFPSELVKDPSCRKPTRVVRQVLAQCRPKVVWTHSPWDQHESHRFTFQRVVAALLELPLNWRPGLLLGGEVWGPLGWVDDRFKLSFDISNRLAQGRRILQQYESQIVAHHYDEGAAGRWKSNAVFRDSHEVQKSRATVYAADLTPLIDEDPMSIDEFVSRVVSASLGFEYPILNSRRTSALPVPMASRQASPPRKPLKKLHNMETQNGDTEMNDQYQSLLSALPDGTEPPMYREILEQPGKWEAHLAHLLPNRLVQGGLSDLLKSAAIIDIVGIGSSEHAGWVASEHASTKKVNVQSSTLYRPIGDLAIFLSQSGRTTDTLEAVERAKTDTDPPVRVVGITTDPNSTLARKADEAVVLDINEQAIAATASMTTTVLAIEAILAAGDGRTMEADAGLADTLGQFIDDQRQPGSVLGRLVSSLSNTQYVAVLGHGPAYTGVAREIALKLRETVGGVMAEGFDLREFQHGFVSSLTSELLAKAGVPRAAILLETDQVPREAVEFYTGLDERYRGTAREFRLLRLSPGEAKSPGGLVFPQAGTNTSLIAIVLGQMLAHEWARQKGFCPGTSDVLQKAVVTRAEEASNEVDLPMSSVSASSAD